MPEEPDQLPGAGSLAPADHPPIAFADEVWAATVAQAAAFGVELGSHRATVQALYGHLVGVNAWFNLTRITGPEDYLKLHLLDSLSLMLDKRLKHLRDGSPIIDLGSGGGYPGLPLALLQPGKKWILVDSRQRKVAFLQAALGLIPGCRGEARAFRGRETVSAAPDLRRKCQVVLSRAVGRSALLLDEAKDLVMPHGHVILAKGPAYADDEHAEALERARPLGYRFVHRHSVTLAPGDPERCIVVWERER